MNSLRHRSYHKELLDGSDIPFFAIQKNMEELDIINRKLGGHAVTLKGLQQLMGKKTVAKLSIVEIGCGGGDNLRVIKEWAEKSGINVFLQGIDINKECIRYAEALPANSGIGFVCSDYKDVVFAAPPHIIFSSLFCHHFTDEELVTMLRWMQSTSSTGFFINDLHRHAVAYYSIKLITHLFSKSYLVMNDAPLSVTRGFVRKDWIRLFSEAGISNYQCQWKWAFRWLVTSANHATATTI